MCHGQCRHGFYQICRSRMFDRDGFIQHPTDVSYQLHYPLRYRMMKVQTSMKCITAKEDNPCTLVPTDFQLRRKMKFKFHFRFSFFFAL